MPIRSAISRDFKYLVDIYVKAFRTSFRGHLPDIYLDTFNEKSPPAITVLEGFKNGTVFVYEEDAPLGFIQLIETGGQMELKLLYISPDAQGKGIGKQLLSKTTEFAQQRGYSEVIIWTLQNGPGRGFYEKHGARVTGKNRRWIEDTIIVELMLPVKRDQ